MIDAKGAWLSVGFVSGSLLTSAIHGYVDYAVSVDRNRHEYEARARGERLEYERTKQLDLLKQCGAMR